ncbi:MAG: hypothetical protein OXC93_16905 [Rhodospirillaceae bacterium]|nr:hypothetical protein [Rhodospirillaceae bacterium]
MQKKLKGVIGAGEMVKTIDAACLIVEVQGSGSLRRQGAGGA